MVKHLQEEPSEIKGLRHPSANYDSIKRFDYGNAAEETETLHLLNCIFTDGYKDAGDDPETVRKETEFAERLNKQEDIYVEK